MRIDNQGVSPLSDLNDKQGKCPLCEQQNQCALILNESRPCWCEAISLLGKPSDIELALEVLQEGTHASNRLTIGSIEETKTCLCSTCLIKINTLSKRAK